MGWRLLLLIMAIFCAIVAALIGFEVITSDLYGGWLATAVALGLASRLP